MDKDEAIKEVADELQKFSLDLQTQQYTYHQLQQQITARINYLIANDFHLLISILYRLDISEKKLKQLLRQPSQSTAGDIIAEMIIERQLQKIAARKAFNRKEDIPENEKW